MRTTISRLALALVLGAAPLASSCTSNWTCPPEAREDGLCVDLRDPTVPKPYWRDCDGDGLGDGAVMIDPETGMPMIDGDGSPMLRPRTCLTDEALAANPPTECPNDDGTFVQNARDCDDGYAASGGGSRNGANCPGNFGPVLGGPVAPVDYEVARVGEKEFLIFRDREVDDGTARAVCDSWRIGSIGEDYEPGTIDLPPEPLATLDTPFELGQFVDLVREGLQPGESWVGWVGVNSPIEFNEDQTAIIDGVTTAAWQWNTSPEPLENLGLGFCSGVAPIPSDVLLGVAWPYIESYEEIDPDEIIGTPFEQQLQDLRLVLFVEADEDVPCLTYASDPLVCPDGAPCFANTACERDRLDPLDVPVFELDPENTCSDDAAPAG
jgi:hypothetical protein